MQPIKLPNGNWQWTDPQGSIHTGTEESIKALASGTAAPGAGSAPGITPTLPSAAPEDHASLPTLPSLPPSSGGPNLNPSVVPDRSLPTTSSSGLVGFANALNQAVNLAKQKRNTLMLQFMGNAAPAGTVPASDFSSVLSRFNAASDTTGRDLIDQATTIAGNEADKANAAASDNLTQIRQITLTALQNGAPNDIVAKMYAASDPIQAAAIGAKYLQSSGGSSSSIFNNSGSSSVSPANPTNLPKPVTSGTLTATGQDQLEVINILRTGKSSGGTAYGNAAGSDGWADPNVYLKLLANWQKNGGQISDFVRLYPPKDYINPANTWIGAELAKYGVSWSSPAAPKASSSSSSSSSRSI